MKKTYLFLAVLLGSTIITGCQKKEESAGDANDPIYGKWVYENPGSTSTKAKGMAATLNSNGEIIVMNLFAVSDGSTASIVFRKSIGTFTKSGDRLSLKYSYETCNPVGSEVFLVKVDPSNSNRLIVSTEAKDVVFTMNRVVDSKSDITFTAVEDKNCNLISKIINESRKPASVKSVLEFSKP